MKNRSRPVTLSLGFGITPKAKIVKGLKDCSVPRQEPKARILVVTPDSEMRRITSTRLAVARYAVEAVDGAQAALDSCMRNRPHLVITDSQLGEMDGFSLMKELKGRWPGLSVIILTSHGTIREAVRATQYGAFGFLVWPVDKCELLQQVQRAIEESTFVTARGNWRAAIVSRGKLMEDRLGQANWAAGNAAPVVLTGENGTGKELFARAIHAASRRRDKSFIVVNCRTLTESALEVELFGPEGGGVDAAEKRASGAIQAARGGTLLLEEIGDLSVRLQLRLIDSLRIKLISDDDRGSQSHDVRLICTSSCNLKELMDAGDFRQDLYYRINILPIEIPPLGRRREDIPLLISHFLEQATEHGGSQRIYSAEAIELMATADWPGNVRQLFDLVKQNVALSRDAVMTKAFVQQSLGADGTRIPTYEEARGKFSHDYLANTLQQTKGNIAKSARLAKRGRTDFYKLLERHRVLEGNSIDAAQNQNDAR